MREFLLGAAGALAVGCAIATNGAASSAGPASPSNGERISVIDFGARGDCSTDDAPAFAIALKAASGRELWVPTPPGGCYRWARSVGSIPENTRLQGESKASTKIEAQFSGGAALVMADGSSIDNIWLDGDGAVYSADGIQITGAAGNQNITNSRIINFNGHPLYFTDVAAGSRFNAENDDIWQTRGSSGSGRCAITIEDAPFEGGAPKTFFHIETGGLAGFCLGGANDVAIIGGSFADVVWSKNTHSVQLIGVRIDGVNETLTILGDGNMIVASDVYPIVTIGPGALATVLGPGTFNQGCPTDLSGNDSNLIFCEFDTPWKPIVKFGAFTETIANRGLSEVAGNWTRNARRMQVDAEFTIGTLVPSPGALTVSLPFASAHAIPQMDVSGRILHRGAIYRIQGYIAPGARVINFERDTSGTVSNISPVTLSRGDLVQITAVYQQ